MPGSSCVPTRGQLPDVSSKAPPLKWRWLDAVIDAPSLRSTEKLVAVAMARFGDRDGRNVYPGTAKIAKRTGYHRSTVERAREGLVKAGWLERVVRGGIVNGERINSRYELRLPAQEGESAAPTPRTERTDSPSYALRLPAQEGTIPCSYPLDLPRGSRCPECDDHPHGRAITADDGTTVMAPCHCWTDERRNEWEAA